MIKQNFPSNFPLSTLLGRLDHSLSKVEWRSVLRIRSVWIMRWCSRRVEPDFPASHICLQSSLLLSWSRWLWTGLAPVTRRRF